MTKIEKAIKLQQEAIKLLQECIAAGKQLEQAQDATPESVFIEPDQLGEIPQLASVQSLADMAKSWVMQRSDKTQATQYIKQILAGCGIEKFSEVKENSDAHKLLEQKINALVFIRS